MSQKITEERLERERIFHDERFGGSDEHRLKADKYYSAFIRIRQHYKNRVLKYLKGGRLLEYGCGTGSMSRVWLENGATLTGIDISGEAIRKSKENISQTGYDAEFLEMNAEETSFDNDTFDIVCGSGILHHLVLENAYAELARIMKPEGHAVFIEPMGHNPVINFYRRLTPEMRTEDEHPFTKSDVMFAGKYFRRVNADYFNIFTLLTIPLRNTKLFRPLFHFFHAIDQLIITLIPPLRYWAWVVVLDLSEPVKK
jgi:ubiquinone/menaquinone biosynthesis C-methylase UbiE